VSRHVALYVAVFGGSKEDTMGWSCSSNKN